MSCTCGGTCALLPAGGDQPIPNYPARFNVLEFGAKGDGVTGVRNPIKHRAYLLYCLLQICSSQCVHQPRPPGCAPSTALPCRLHSCFSKSPESCRLGLWRSCCGGATREICADAGSSNHQQQCCAARRWSELQPKSCCVRVFKSPVMAFLLMCLLLACRRLPPPCTFPKLCPVSTATPKHGHSLVHT